MDHSRTGASTVGAQSHSPWTVLCGTVLPAYLCLCHVAWGGSRCHTCGASDPICSQEHFQVSVALNNGCYTQFCTISSLECRARRLVHEFILGLMSHCSRSTRQEKNFNTTPHYDTDSYEC